MYSKKTNSMTIPLDEDEFNIRYEMWKNDTHIRDAFPMLNATQRDFISLGITQNEWTEISQITEAAT